MVSIKNIMKAYGHVFVVIVACIAIIVIYPFTYFDMFKYILFQIAYVIIPSIMFSWLILRKDKVTIIERVVVGYPITIFLLFVLYWIGEMAGIHWFHYGMIIPAILFIYLLITRKIAFAKNDTTLTNITIAFYCICICIFIISFSITATLPQQNRLGLYYQDSLWTIGNTWSLIRGFPLTEARLSGVPFSYHMLQNIYQAVTFRATGIDPFRIHFYFEPLFDWFYIIATTVYCGKQFTKTGNKGIVIFSFLVFLTAGFGIMNGLQSHLYNDPLSLFFGLPFFIVLFYFIQNYQKYELNFLYISILYILAAATKAHLLFIVPASVAVALILIKRKKFSLIEIRLLIFLLISFLFLKITIFSSSGNEIEPLVDPASFLSLGFIQFVKTHYIQIVTVFCKKSIYNFGSIIMDPIFIFPIIAAISSPNNRKGLKLDPMLFVFTVAFIILSVCAVSIADFKGGGVYFIWYSRIILLFLMVPLYTCFFENRISKIRLLAITIMIVGFIEFGYNRVKWFQNNWWIYPRGVDKIWDPRAGIDAGEWKAMEWMKKNTPTSSVFFSDRKYFIHESNPSMVCGRFFGYSALSGRKAYCEGDEFLDKENKKKADERWNIVDKFIAENDKEKKEKDLCLINADYFIQSKRFNMQKVESINGLKLVFSNESINIYSKKSQ